MDTFGKQPTYRRQRFLLTFIRQLRKGVSATDLQKLVFLYGLQTGADFYEFVPYKFGSFSFQLAEDVDILRRDGYLNVDSSIGATRIQATETNVFETPFQIAPERGNNLIRRAYRISPYYAINSEILDRLFEREEADRFRAEKLSYKKEQQVLFTIGYEGKGIEAFVNTLIKGDVRLICDVRKNPISRKFGFSKRKLAHILQTVGILYVHMPELGIVSEKRTSLNTVEDYETLFYEYAQGLPRLKPQLEKIYSLLCRNKRVALMCYEKNAVMCHRHIIRDFLVEEYNVESEDTL